MIVTLLLTGMDGHLVLTDFGLAKADLGRALLSVSSLLLVSLTIVGWGTPVCLFSPPCSSSLLSAPLLFSSLDG
jgi:hypothetical protein